MGNPCFQDYNPTASLRSRYLRAIFKDTAPFSFAIHSLSNLEPCTVIGCTCARPHHRVLRITYHHPDIDDLFGDHASE